MLLSTYLLLMYLILNLNCHHSKNRRQPKNMILAGIWFSDEKPLMQLYLKPIAIELETAGW